MGIKIVASMPKIRMVASRPGCRLETSRLVASIQEACWLVSRGVNKVFKPLR